MVIKKMNKIRFFVPFLTVASMAITIALTSCSNPVTPDGTTLGMGSGQTPGEDNGNTPYSIIGELALLRQNAQSGTSHEILVRNNEQFESTQVIHFPDRQDITVTIRSSDNTRRILSVSGSHTMFQVQGHNITLVLENITLQGHYGNQNSLVIVNQGSTLKMETDSIIRGNHGRGVSVNGGTFIMNNNASVTANLGEGVHVGLNGRVYMNDNARIHNNSAGVIAMHSILTMNDNAAIHHNHSIGDGLRAGGVFLSGPASRLFMYDFAQIHNNTATGGYRSAGGVLATNFGRIYMYGNASINYNLLDSSTGSGGVTLVGGVLNMFNADVQVINNASGGPPRMNAGVWVGNSPSEFNISGGTISTNWFIALYVISSGSLPIAREGVYIPSGGSAPGTLGPPFINLTTDWGPIVVP